MSNTSLSEAFAQALRDLVAELYNNLYGAYGVDDGDTYAGQYEREIKKVTNSLDIMIHQIVRDVLDEQVRSPKNDQA